MPPEQELPEPLRPLCRLQACEISDNRWEFDVRRLADVLEPLIAEPVKSPTAAAPAGVTSTTTMPCCSASAMDAASRYSNWRGIWLTMTL